MNWIQTAKLAQTTPVPPTPASPVPAQSPVAAPAFPASAAPLAGTGVQATITTNKYGKRFLVLLGNTFALNKVLRLGKGGLNFQYFQGTWSKRIDFVSTLDRQTLASHGVDTSILDGPQATGPEQPAVPEEPKEPNAPKTPASEQLAKFKAEIDKEMNGASGNSARVKAILNHIDKTLDKLAASVDEAAKKDFIKTFLAFATKFWNYSFSNQMLIYMQKRGATYVSGHKQWLEKGRQVVNWDAAISILAPMTKTIKEESPSVQVNPNDKTGDRRIMFFRPVSVYDISDTKPIEGWKDKAGNGPFEGTPPLKTNSNEENEQVTVLVNAAAAFAKSVGVSVDLGKDLPENLGGYSKGGETVVNSKYKGINQFSTLVHELAHETLHWKRDTPSLIPKEQMRNLRQEREIDAEATAYIVLAHFGFHSDDAPNYLALWRADSAQVKARREHISNAVKVIIKGIEQQMSHVAVPDEEEHLEAQASIGKNWWKTLISSARYFAKSLKTSSCAVASTKTGWYDMFVKEAAGAPFAKTFVSNGVTWVGLGNSYDLHQKFNLKNAGFQFARPNPDKLWQMPLDTLMKNKALQGQLQGFGVNLSFLNPAAAPIAGPTAPGAPAAPAQPRPAAAPSAGGFLVTKTGKIMPKGRVDPTVYDNYFKALGFGVWVPQGSRDAVHLIGKDNFIKAVQNPANLQILQSLKHFGYDAYAFAKSIGVEVVDPTPGIQQPEQGEGQAQKEQTVAKEADKFFLAMRIADRAFVVAKKNPAGPGMTAMITTNDLKGAAGSVPETEFTTQYQIIQGPSGQPVDSVDPDEVKRQAEGFAMSPEEINGLRAKHVLPDAKMNEEGKAIDERFLMMENDPEHPSHMMISALAGSGKTTMLKHLAWKYGHPGAKWLYLVFNKKNEVEAKEKFPTWVTVKTTNAFLGNVLDKHNGGNPNIGSTRRMMSIENGGGGKGKEGDDDGAGVPEKIRYIADSRNFSGMMNEAGIREMAGDQIDYINSQYSDVANGRLGNALYNFINRTIQYKFKAEAIKLAELCKAYAVDPRSPDMDQKLNDVSSKYDIDFGMSEPKEKIMGYKGHYQLSFISALAQVFGYDFMQKDYTNEIKNAAKWLLKVSLPGETDAKYKHTNNKWHDLGEYRDFSDDLWLPAINADKTMWPHYDFVLADEVQDFNECQSIMLKKLAQAGARIVAVGDQNQCHPAGTLIALTGGDYKPIENLKVGDSLVTYNSKKSYFPGTNSQGRKVLEVAKRQYNGRLLSIETDEESYECTPNHRCLVRLSSKPAWGLYLMVKGNSARMGICRLKYQNGFGLTIRAVQEGADKAWLLKAYDQESEARVDEIVWAARFGLPQIIFCNKGQASPTQSVIDRVYAEVGNNIPNAKQCLTAFGRDFAYPIWSKGEMERFGKMKQNYIGSKKSFVTQACNLVSGFMEVRTFDGNNRGGRWKPCSVVSKHVNCEVYSLSVEATEDGKQLYIANNIVTHNSIYRFRGADSNSFGRVGQMLEGISANKDVVKSLSRNFRSRKAILDFVNQNTHVKNLQQGKQFADGDGTVTDKQMDEHGMFGQLAQEWQSGQMPETAILSRTNEPLAESALQLLGSGVPFVIVGKDVAKDLVNHVKKIMRLGGNGRNKEVLEKAMQSTPVDKFVQSMESHTQSEVHRYGRSAAKRAYIQELQDRTNAVAACAHQFLTEANPEGSRPMAGGAMSGNPAQTNVAKFVQWVGAKLKGLNIEDSERDLAAYNAQMKSERPPVTLTTAHRSKGLEFSRVFVMRPEMFPHPKSTREEDLQQEKNAYYVSLSRARDALHILKPKPKDKE